MRYQLELPGRGEIFPALTVGAPAEYWPVGILTLTNDSEHPAMQVVSTEVVDWSLHQEQTLILGAHESRQMRLAPTLLPDAYRIRRSVAHRSAFAWRMNAATHFLRRRVPCWCTAPMTFIGDSVSPTRNSSHAGSRRTIPPCSTSISEARRFAPDGRLAGYLNPPRTPTGLDSQIRMQANAVFRALSGSGISYVSSIYTFGDHAGDAQRIRLPRETLSLNNANCMDVSVVFASAMENLGMKPVVVIIPGHAFTGIKMGENSQQILYLDLTVLPRGTFEQAIARAQGWLKKTPPEQVLTVDIAAARAMGIYPM